MVIAHVVCLGAIECLNGRWWDYSIASGRLRLTWRLGFDVVSVWELHQII
jgi:hypothetical protein